MILKKMGSGIIKVKELANDYLTSIFMQIVIKYDLLLLHR